MACAWRGVRVGLLASPPWLAAAAVIDAIVHRFPGCAVVRDVLVDVDLWVLALSGELRVFPWLTRVLRLVFTSPGLGSCSARSSLGLVSLRSLRRAFGTATKFWFAPPR